MNRRAVPKVHSLEARSAKGSECFRRAAPKVHRLEARSATGSE